VLESAFRVTTFPGPNHLKRAFGAFIDALDDPTAAILTEGVNCVCRVKVWPMTQLATVHLGFGQARGRRSRKH
jgi:hypothetical protein